MVRVHAGPLNEESGNVVRPDQPERKLEGGLAQLARAPALQAGGHRFDSDILHELKLKLRTRRVSRKFIERYLHYE